MIDAQYQAWQQAVQQQNAQYDAQLRQAMDAATLHQALNYPRQYGFGRMANPLMAPAQNSATALFGAANPEAANLMLANYMMQAPGGNTIGLPGDSGVDSSNALLARLLGQSGVG